MTDEQFTVFTACEALKIPKEVYLRIIAKAVEQTEKDLLELQSAHKGNDIGIVQAISHRFKGDFANLRVTVLSDIASQLNVLAKGNYNSDQAAMLIGKFLKAFEEVKHILSEYD